MVQSGKRGNSFIFFLLYLVLGLYLLNYRIGYIKIPEVLSGWDKWIIFAGGVLLILGSFKFLGSRRNTV